MCYFNIGDAFALLWKLLQDNMNFFDKEREKGKMKSQHKIPTKQENPGCLNQAKDYVTREP